MEICLRGVEAAIKHQHNQSAHFFAYFGLIFALLTHFPHWALILICIPLRIPLQWLCVHACGFVRVCVCGLLNLLYTDYHSLQGCLRVKIWF